MMANPKPHIPYKRLNSSKNEFRLLELQPGQNLDDRVECRLITLPLTDDVEFLALSSLYGDPTVTETIFVNGHRLPVPLNIAQAIRHVRAVFLSTTSYTFSDSASNQSSEKSVPAVAPAKDLRKQRRQETSPAPRWLKYAMRHVRSILPQSPRHQDAPPPKLLLWLDAICINKHDAAEIKDQRQAMRHIYRQAKTVIGWVGLKDAEGLTERAVENFRLIDELMPPHWGDADDQTLHPENYAPHHEWVKKLSFFWDPLLQIPPGPGYGHPQPLSSNVTRPARTTSNSDEEEGWRNEISAVSPFLINGNDISTSQTWLDSPWYALNVFLSRDYFNRQWIIDEIAMAKFPTFLAGDRILSWKHLLRLNRLIEELRDTQSNVFPPAMRPLLHTFPLGIVYSLLSELDRQNKEDKKNNLGSTRSSEMTSNEWSGEKS